MALMPRKHPPDPPPYRINLELTPELGAWLDRVISEARARGHRGIGVSLIVRRGLADLATRDPDELIAELAKARREGKSE